MKVLVINAGSSSCKYQLLEMDTETVLASGLAERIGQGMGKLTHKIAPDSDHEEKIVRESAFPTHVEAMELVISLLTDPEKGVIKDKSEIYAIGLPSVIMIAIGSVMTFLMNKILITYHAAHETAATAFGVYFKLQSFFFMPVFGLNQGALPVMGYNYGARNRRRLMGAYRITLTAAVVIMALGLVLFQLLPEQMLMLFVDRTDAAAAQEMIEVGVPALKTISLSFLGAAFGIINSTLFQATARGMNSLIVSVCRQLVVILPAAWILGQQFGLNAVWYSFPIAEIAAFFISYILLWREYRTELRFLGTEKEKKA